MNCLHDVFKLEKEAQVGGADEVIDHEGSHLPHVPERDGESNALKQGAPGARRREQSSTV
jgi:hypothetical protein